MKNNYKSALKRIIENQKMGISFESEDLISEAQTDIYEFGAKHGVAVWIDPKVGFIKDYDLSISKEEFMSLADPLDDCDDDEPIVDGFWDEYEPGDIYVMELYQLVALLEFQNTILPDYSIVSRKNIKERASKAASGFWENLSAEERSRIARERGKAGAAKR